MTRISARPLSAAVLGAFLAVVSPAQAHQLCGIWPTLDTQPRTVADGAIQTWSVRFCEQTGTVGDRIEYATIPIDPASFVPSSAAWVACPTGGCSIVASGTAAGTMTIPAFTLKPYECVTFSFTVTLRRGLRGQKVCNQGQTRMYIGGSSIPCDSPIDDPEVRIGSLPTCVTVEDLAPGCKLTATVTPAVYSGCSGVPVGLDAGSSTSSGCTGGVLSYQWSRDSEDIPGATLATYTLPASTPPEAATYQCLVSCAAMASCANLSNAVPVTLLGAEDLLAPDSVCTGKTVNVSVPAGATCTLNCGNGSPPVAACVAACTYSLQGSYVVRADVTDGSGCKSSLSRPLQAIAPPTACIGALPAICEAATAGPTYVKLPNCSLPGVTYTWSSSPGALDDPAAFSPWLVLPDVSVRTAVTVTLGTSATGCGPPSQTQKSFDLLPAPDAAFTVSPPEPCAGASVSFHPTSLGAGLSYLWDFGDSVTSTLAEPVHVFTTPATYRVTLTTTDPATGCSATSPWQVVVTSVCCPAVMPEVGGVYVTKYPTSADVYVQWTAPSWATGAHVWSATIKQDIPNARLGATFPMTEVCPSPPLTNCTDWGRVTSTTWRQLFYQVRGVCLANEGE